MVKGIMSFYDVIALYLPGGGGGGGDKKVLYRHINT